MSTTLYMQRQMGMQARGPIEGKHLRVRYLLHRFVYRVEEQQYTHGSHWSNPAWNFAMERSQVPLP